MRLCKKYESKGKKEEQTICLARAIELFFKYKSKETVKKDSIAVHSSHHSCLEGKK